MIVSPLAGDRIGGSDTSFVIVEWTIAADEAGRPMAPFHVHHEDDEAWYVLEGTLGFRVGDEEIEAPAGAAVMVPRGTPHTFWNAGTGAVRYLLVMSPAIHALVEEVLALPTREPAAVRAVFARHSSSLVD
jgi:mannose-6-phosphate isomerase-like protein (cupin superfamily)